MYLWEIVSIAISPIYRLAAFKRFEKEIGFIKGEVDGAKKILLLY